MNILTYVNKFHKFLEKSNCRILLFWTTLIIFLSLVLSGHLLQMYASYSLKDYPGMKFGSFGFYLANLPKKTTQQHKTIIFLGNSVYHYSGIVEEIIEISNKNEDKFDLFNLGQVSSGIYDHLIQAAKIIKHKPDLLVISLEDLGLCGLIRFRSDSDQMAFDPDVLKVLPTSFYLRYFDYKNAISSIFSTLMPIKRLDPILRYEFKLRDRLPKWFIGRISYPFLNIGRQELRNLPINTQANKIHEDLSFEAFETLHELLSMLKKFDIPVLVIRQESNPPIPVIYNKTKEIILSYSNAYFVNNQHHWKKENFHDHVHPKSKEVHNYATRHYNAVIQALNHFNKTQGENL